MAPQSIERLDAISDNYDLILCDVWGVLHNGVQAWTKAHRALARAREAGKIVVLITNAPRPFKSVKQQLELLGVPSDTFDGIVTSGDVTRALISKGPSKVFHIGEDRDLPIYEGLDVTLVAEEAAEAIVCTGLFDDSSEDPSDYSDLFQRLQARDLPFICANPDIVVEKGDSLIYCAGALARDYATLGGRTFIAGKPFKPIYDEAIRIGQERAGKAIDRARILAIGDGMPTDVKGAMDNGLDLLFISDGIHSREYGEPSKPDFARLEKFLSDQGAVPIATMTKLG